MDSHGGSVQCGAIDEVTERQAAWNNKSFSSPSSEAKSSSFDDLANINLQPAGED